MPFENFAMPETFGEFQRNALARDRDEIRDPEFLLAALAASGARGWEELAEQVAEFYGATQDEKDDLAYALEDDGEITLPAF